MSDKNRHQHIAPNGLLSLGNISGLLHEVNGQQHVIGGNADSTSVPEKPQTKASSPTKADMQAVKPKSQGNASNGKDKSKSKPTKETAKPKLAKAANCNDTFSYIASRLQSDTHRINRKADKVAYIRTEIITAYRQCYREKATQAINEVLRKYIEDNKERLREQRTDKGSLLDR